ncbi:MAG: hypothetical protein JW841_04315 [Deltaproteobacteria bacterium]|nr:hypothetical protein [Deltaproteobacteria bacterium]
MRAWVLAICCITIAFSTISNAQESNENTTTEPETDKANTKPDAPKEYKVELTKPKELISGVAGDCAYTITPLAPWQVKYETPFSAQLEASEQLQLEKTKLTAKDFLDPKATNKSVHTACTANTTGKHTLKAKIIFFLCSHEICKRTIAQITSTIIAH